MTRNHFSKHGGPYFVSDKYTKHQQDMEKNIEVFVYRVLRSISFIPRRFWRAAKAGIKKITNSL